MRKKRLLRTASEKCGADFESWVKHFHSGETKDTVESYLLLVKQYNIQGVPALVINGNLQITVHSPFQNDSRHRRNCKRKRTDIC